MKKILTFNEIIAILREISETAVNFDDFICKFYEVADFLNAIRSHFVLVWDDHIFNENGAEIGFTESIYDDKLYLINCNTDKEHDITKYMHKVLDKYEK